MVPMWILRVLTYHLKVMHYRDFLPKRKKRPWGWFFLKKYSKKAAEYALSEADKNCFMPEESLMNDESGEERQDWLTVLGVLSQKWIGGAGDIMKNTGLDHSAWRVDLEMALRGRQYDEE